MNKDTQSAFPWDPHGAPCRAMEHRTRITYNEILCSETFDRARTIRVSLYRPQTALSRARRLQQDRIGCRGIGKSNMRPVNTANSLDQHIRGLIWRSGRYVPSGVVCPVTLAISARRGPSRQRGPKLFRILPPANKPQLYRPAEP